MKKINKGDSGPEVQDLYKTIGQIQIQIEEKYANMDELLKEIEELKGS